MKKIILGFSICNVILLLGLLLIMILLVEFHDSKPQTETINPGYDWSFNIESEKGDNIELILHHSSLPVTVYFVDSVMEFQINNEYIWKDDGVTEREWNWVVHKDSGQFTDYPDWSIVIRNYNEDPVEVEVSARVDNGFFSNIFSSDVFLPLMIIYGSVTLLGIIVIIVIYFERKKKQSQAIFVSEENISS